MKKDKTKKPFDPDEEYYDDYGFGVGSTTDCTGLMHKPPLSKYEYASYNDIEDIDPSDDYIDPYKNI